MKRVISQGKSEFLDENETKNIYFQNFLQFRPVFSVVNQAYIYKGKYAVLGRLVHFFNMLYGEYRNQPQNEGAYLGQQKSFREQHDFTNLLQIRDDYNNWPEEGFH